MRGVVSVGAVVALVVLAGCSATVLDPDCSRSRGGSLSGTVVETPPANATVADADRLPEGATLVRERLNETVTSGDGRTELGPGGVCRAEDTLAELPRHDGDRSGYYLRADGVVVRIELYYDT